LVRQNLPVVTLAIGDGANDVAMIQEAHIGIGISGMEGTQAARSSDYSIAQFKYLKPLLFVHGRIGYSRVSTFLSYYFYKNVVLCLTEFWFAWYNGFSGQLYFPSMYSLCYNAFYTSFPAFIALGMDRDVSISRCLSTPKLFYWGQDSLGFNTGVFSTYILRAIYQGLICFYIPYLVMVTPEGDGILRDSNWYVGTAAFFCVVLLVTLQLVLEVTTWTLAGFIACIVSILLFVVASLVMAIPAVAHIGFFDYYSETIMFILLGDVRFWLVLLVTVRQQSPLFLSYLQLLLFILINPLFVL
jgi:magnesium-transporting ATPase (P-type)